MCVAENGNTTLGLCPDGSRDEKVSFKGRLKRPLVFRDAMLMLRQIVVSDATRQKKERPEFFQWLEGEIERRAVEHERHQPGIRMELQNAIGELASQLASKDSEITAASRASIRLNREIDSDAWGNFYRLQGKFSSFLRFRDPDLYFALDPVITVHPDEVSFEAFSIDESVYGCLSVKMDEFDLLQEPGLGTTNIDFSAKLATEIERFRTYSQVQLSVNPLGFAVDTGMAPGYIEKKIDLPESWVKGFTQVSSAASMDGATIDLSPVDMYDICAFLRRHNTQTSPRYMKWALEKGKPARIVFEPYGAVLELKAEYTGENQREEKIWGRQRWLVAEKLIPLAKSFQVKFLGFGMPQFIIADLGNITMTIGFSSWSANDWVKGTAFNLMSGFIGDGAYEEVYSLLKERRKIDVSSIHSLIGGKKKSEVTSGIGAVLKRGEGYFDAANNVLRFRKLMSEPLPPHLYETTPAELAVAELMGKSLEDWQACMKPTREYLFTNRYQESGRTIQTEIEIDMDGQISAVKCQCREFNKGQRNISAPCPHIIALYLASAKFTRYDLQQGIEYKINDILPELLG